MKNYYIGIMSGTSLDGVDAVLCQISSTGKTQVLLHAEVPMDKTLRESYFQLQTPSDNEIHLEALAANALAHHYHRAIQLILQRSELQHTDIVAIGAHGQTIRHQPGLYDGIGYTKQSLNAALLAEISGIDVIADFRSRDVAAGGQGAPLVPAFHAAQFMNNTPTTVVNIGGIANLSILPKDSEQAVIGFDTGPGNALMDYWTMTHLHQAFDEDGAWAASGTVIPQLLESFLSDPYFSKEAPKSTGRDLFNPTWLNYHLEKNTSTTASPADVQATLLALTSISIADHIKAYAPNTERVLICGGGVKNKALIDSLTTACPSISVIASTSSCDIDPQTVEAAAFAWLAWAHKTKQPANLPAVTGAKGLRILGAIYPA
jgi:anhydro-N-acetylmuramic acid kinase